MNDLFEKSDSLNSPIECFMDYGERNSFPIRPHWHYFMEIIYITQGTAQLRSGSEVFSARKGNMILFHPKSVHSICSDEPSSLEYGVFKLDINCINMTSGYAPKLRSIFKSAEQRGMDIFFDSSVSEAMGAERIFESCIREMEQQKYGYTDIIRSNIYCLLIGMLRHWQENGFKVDSKVFDGDSVYDIYSITEYIEDNLGKGIKVTDIADMCRMSYSSFAKRFLRIYGKTCKEYMEEMRFIKAKDFLIFTDFDLTYISQESGFSDCSHLIKTFRQKTGMTPRQFRISQKPLQ